MRQNNTFPILILLGLIMLESGCHHSKKKVANSVITGSVTITADESLKPLINTEIDVFQSLYNSASVKCNYVSEFAAINLLLKGECRLAIVGRALTNKEIDYFKEQNILPESIPLAYDAVAIIVHPNNKTKSINTAQLTEMLSGTCNDWNQINASDRSGNIELIFDSPESGILHYLDDYLKLNKKITGIVKFASGSGNTLEMVASNPNAIGFIGFNLISEADNFQIQETLRKVSLVGVSQNNSTIGIIPSVSTLYRGTYPLIRQIFAIYTDPSAGLAKGFLSHLTSERGQKIIYRNGLKPENDFQRLIQIKEE